MQTFKMDGIDKMKHEVNVSMSDLNQLLSIKNEIVKDCLLYTSTHIRNRNRI